MSFTECNHAEEALSEPDERYHAVVDQARGKQSEFALWKHG
jgi:hypothetical protein